MGIDFLINHGARRVRNYDAQPLLLNMGSEMTNETLPSGTDGLSREIAASDWAPRDVMSSTIPADWPLRPLRFVDGKDVGRTVAWLQSAEGYPVPVRLSQIGAVVMRNVNGTLRREFSVVERVVALMVDFFPWDEVEEFALALQENGFRLLPCQQPKNTNGEHVNLYDFEQMRKTTQNRSNDEMSRLERHALSRTSVVPTLVDGRLEPRASAFDPTITPVIGLIKTHSKNYLHPQGWRTFYQLRPGQRTPAFRLPGHGMDVISWYLRLDGEQGELPNWGVVRVELTEPFFQQQLIEDWTYVDQLSRLICNYRCRDQGYGRAAVSIQPIQEAEESLGAQFTEADSLISRFYRMTNL